MSLLTPKSRASLGIGIPLEPLLEVLSSNFNYLAGSPTPPDQRGRLMSLLQTKPYPHIGN